MRVYYRLYGRLLSMEALYNGFKKVKRANGAAGIDRQSLSDSALNLGSNLKQRLLELREKRYQPLPVKRVEIEKEDGGTRLLGIPAVRDRIVQVVDMDLSKCFDLLDHEFMIKAFRQKVADGSVLDLIRMFLKSGVMTGDKLDATEIGSPHDCMDAEGRAMQEQLPRVELSAP